MTEKLYYENSHLQEFTAKVISCTKSKKGYEAVLDRTAFFPEGGGQFADTGMLGNVNVLDVHERQNIIYHLVDEELEAGTEIVGKIDWKQRFERMQQHSGEHIVSGIIHSKFGYDNVGFHLGNEVCTLDMSGPISKEELKEIEAAANEAVFQNVPVEVMYPSKAELAEMDYRSKIEIEGQVRIVKMAEYDLCACCAPHVSFTGEIGLIKFTHLQNYKGGVRITMVCGIRALRDYQSKDESVKMIMSSLCSKEEMIAESVERLKEENAGYKMQILNLQREILKNKVKDIHDEKAVCLFEEIEGSLIRELMNMVLAKHVEICAVFCGNEAKGFRYVIGSKTEDVRPIVKRLNECFEGRGGGKPDMVQGSLMGKAKEIQRVFEEEALCKKESI